MRGSQTVAVFQLGARRHYAVPVALERAGCLAHFYTDFYGGSFVWRTLAALFGIGPLTSVSGRLLERCHPDLPSDKITAFPLWGLKYGLSTRRAQDPSALTRAWMEGGQSFARKASRKGLHGASVVYAYSSAALEIFEAFPAARRVLDQATAPKLYEDELVRQERRRYPDWFPPAPDDEFAGKYDARQKQEWVLADRILCASSFVKNAVVTEGAAEAKCRIVPLAVEVRNDAKPKTSSGRKLHVLFAGNDGLRKGFPDLVSALGIIKADSVDCAAVGDLRLTQSGLQYCAGRVRLAGPALRHEMRRWYEWADVLVLPSVSDTFGLTVLEAMAQGVPVITTPNTGAADVVRSGIDGFIVPVRRPDVLASKLDEMASRPSMIQPLSEASIQRVKMFSLSSYAERLLLMLDLEAGGDA